ncbi:hypothetical protein D3C86_1617330 [compost metagenome]
MDWRLALLDCGAPLTMTDVPMELILSPGEAASPEYWRILVLLGFVKLGLETIAPGNSCRISPKCVACICSIALREITVEVAPSLRCSFPTTTTSFRVILFSFNKNWSSPIGNFIFCCSSSIPRC